MLNAVDLTSKVHNRVDQGADGSVGDSEPVAENSVDVVLRHARPGFVEFLSVLQNRRKPLG